MSKTMSQGQKIWAAALAVGIVLGVPVLGTGPAHARHGGATATSLKTGDAVAANSSIVSAVQDAQPNCDPPGPRASCDLTTEQRADVQLVQMAEGRTGNNIAGSRTLCVSKFGPIVFCPDTIVFPDF